MYDVRCFPVRSGVVGTRSSGRHQARRTVVGVNVAATVVVIIVVIVDADVEHVDNDDDDAGAAAEQVG
jgi:hypothetical protein